MRPTFLGFFLFFLFLLFTFPALPPSRVPPGLASLIRKDHPRLFFNADTFPAVRARALGPDAEDFARMRGRVETLDPARTVAPQRGLFGTE